MDWRRVRAAIVVTILSAAAGAIAGAAVAMALDVLTVGFTQHSVSLALHGYMYGVGALIGGVLGTILGPIAGFGFLRRVPLGRLFAQTILGATLGGLLALGLGILFPRRGDGLILLFGGSVLGFVVAALLLWRRFKAAPAALEKVAS